MDMMRREALLEFARAFDNWIDFAEEEPPEGEYSPDRDHRQAWNAAFSAIQVAKLQVELVTSDPDILKALEVCYTFSREEHEGDSNKSTKEREVHSMEARKEFVKSARKLVFGEQPQADHADTVMEPGAVA